MIRPVRAGSSGAPVSAALVRHSGAAKYLATTPVPYTLNALNFSGTDCTADTTTDYIVSVRAIIQAPSSPLSRDGGEPSAAEMAEERAIINPSMTI